MPLEGAIIFRDLVGNLRCATLSVTSAADVVSTILTGWSSVTGLTRSYLIEPTRSRLSEEAGLMNFNDVCGVRCPGSGACGVGVGFVVASKATHHHIRHSLSLSRIAPILRSSISENANCFRKVMRAHSRSGAAFTRSR